MGLLQVCKAQVLCHLLILCVFVVSGLVVNLLQLLTLPLWGASKQLARTLNCRLGYCISSQMVWLLEWWSGTECTLYTDPESYRLYGNENAIVILNHAFEIDFLCGWTFCERFGVLGSSKVMAKKELAYVPIIGWMWYFQEIVFCKRKWEEDRRNVTQSLQNLRDYPENFWVRTKNLIDYPENFWFLLFCEGTCFTPHKHQISMEVADSKGLPRLTHHLLPRTKGFWVTVQNLRGTVTAVYDSTLNFRNNETPTLRGVLSGKKYHADLYVRRIPLDSIPEDEAECAAWLHKLYQEKDSFQEQYVRSGRFPGPVLTPPRRRCSLLNWVVWAGLVLWPLLLLLLRLLHSGSTLTIATSLAVCIAVSFAVHWMIGQTEIKKSSGYGNKEAATNHN